MQDKELVILHYANIELNKASGVSVIVPQMVSAQAELAQVAFYNYNGECFPISEKVKNLSDTKNDDYHTFPAPFHRPDIVVFHSPFGIPRIPSLSKILRKEGIPYVIVPHGCFSKVALHKRFWKKFLACKLYFGSSFKKVDGMQFLSKGEQQVSKYAANPFILPNGFHIPASNEWKGNTEPFVISYIGRKDIPIKGLDLIVEACEKVKEQLIEKQAVVNIYGPSSGDAKLDQLIQKHQVGQIVKNKPGVFDQEKIEVIQKSSIVILPSRCEGFPVIILESWANGCPTLVTPATHVLEETIENHCGWGVEASADRIADKILYIMNHPDEVRECSVGAYEFVKKTYSWNAVSQKAIKLYREIVRKNDTNY